jgi:pyruvate formate lyase activating enzyme
VKNLKSRGRPVGAEPSGTVFNIQHYSIHDGPGIRTVVFLKGCPLNCRWCCNPESQKSRPELGFRRNLCSGCGECVPACPRNALTLAEETRILGINRHLCTHCGRCVEACTLAALTIYGKRMRVSEVMEDVLQDTPFYLRSGGGVTLSGGEPCMHPSFLLAVLKACRENGVHTAVETSGYVNNRTFRRLLRETDLLLFDLKMMDPEMHRIETGKANDLILANAGTAVRSGRIVQFRMPLVPGVNDSRENLKDLADFLKSIGSPSIELMPYHGFGRSKYEAIGRSYSMGERPGATSSDVEGTTAFLETEGIECRVSW